MRKHPFAGLLALTLMTLACHPGPQVETRSGHHDRAATLLADSASATKARLELERVKLLVGFKRSAPQVQAVEARILAADQVLQQVPPAVAQTAAEIVLLKLDQRAAGLRVKIGQLRVQYTETAPLVQRAEEELRLLLERRTELQG